MTVVVDASALVQALAPDEIGAVGAAVLARVAAAGAIAPQVLADEVAHAAVKGVRCGRWSEDLARRLVEQVGDLGIELVDRTRPSAAQVDLALETGLTAADAAYVLLARDFGLPLVTADAAMRRAAVAVGVDCA